MNIRIHKLTIDNFKCFKHKEFVFENDVVTIKGRNGAGKTTIADAILWCLFGKNSAGQSDFNLKTYDENGKVIPNLDHSVELELNCDFGYTSIKRTLKETWVKKRGTDEQVFKNNTTEYLVNGDSYTASDFKKYIASLVSEDIFKAITNPSYFPSLKWQQQREFLANMVGNISPEEVCGSNDELVKVFGCLTEREEDIVGYLKHLSYQIKQIKDKLDKIPVRIEEQNKALPELLNWENIEQAIQDTASMIQKISDEIVSIKSGNGGDVLRSQIREELKQLQDSVEKIEDTERKAYNLRKSEHDNAVLELSRKFNESVTNQRLMEQTITADERLVERCKATIKDCDKELQHLREIWPTRKFEADTNAAYCPTCGQPLPPDVVEGKIEEMRENFNKALEEEKQSLRDKAAKVKQTKEDAERELTSNQDKLKSDTESLAKMKEKINIIFSDKAKLEKESVFSYEQALSGTKEYQELLQNREELRKKLDSVGMDDDSEKRLAELEARKVEYTDVLQQLNTQLATKSQYDKVQSLIEGIEQDQKDLVRQLSELEKKEDVARQYQERQNCILEERINKHFTLVKWRMFRTINNGGEPFDEPYCECYVDGVAYHDGLNQAARLNAGLDICNTLCKHYGVSAPIIIDNSESSLSILQTEGQQIRLEVADSDLIIA